MSVIPKSGWEDTFFVMKNQSISVYKEEQRIKCSPNRHRLHCLKKIFFYLSGCVGSSMKRTESSLPYGGGGRAFNVVHGLSS